MRILFLAPQPFFEVRGTPLAVRALVRALLAAGHEVELLSFPQGEDADIPGLVHRRSPRLPVGRVKAGASLAKLVLDVPFVLHALSLLLWRRPQVVHAVEEAAFLIAPFTRLLRVPLVTDVDSSIPDQIRYSGFARRGPLPWLAEWLERHALRHSVAAVTVCRSLTDGVRAKAPGLPVFQIEDPPLVDPEQPLQGKDAALLRSAWAADDETERPVVLYSGNFESYQGVELLVEAAALLPDLRFVFMGGEPSEIERLRARAEALGVAGVSVRCVFTGKRAPEELPRFLAAADVLVSPRIEGENTPFKIFTYLASGTPVVATRIPTHTQLLDEAMAFLAEPTPAGLAEAIGRALSNPADARARAQRGREFIGREYGPRRYAEKVATAYAEIARLASPGPPQTHERPRL